MKNFIVGALIIGVAIVIGFLVVNHSNQFGASSGPEHLNLEYFYGGLVQGGTYQTVAIAATTTWTAKMVCEDSVISWSTPGTLGTTTLPTAASLTTTCLARNGDFKDIIYVNSGLAASTTVFTANTGNTVYIPEATGADQVIEGLNVATLRFVRISATAVKVILMEGLVQ